MIKIWKIDKREKSRVFFSKKKKDLKTFLKIYNKESRNSKN